MHYLDDSLARHRTALLVTAGVAAVDIAATTASVFIHPEFASIGPHLINGALTTIGTGIGAGIGGFFGAVAGLITGTFRMATNSMKNATIPAPVILPEKSVFNSGLNKAENTLMSHVLPGAIALALVGGAVGGATADHITTDLLRKMPSAESHHQAQNNYHADSKRPPVMRANAAAAVTAPQHAL